MKIGMLTLAAVCLVVPASPHIQCQPLVNKEYTLVDAPSLAGSNGSLRVVEFFWYGCTYCREFEPLLSSWASRHSAHVTVDFRPVALRGSLLPGAKTFHALKQMSLENRFHSALLAASAAGEVDVELDASIVSWLANHGVDRQEFERVYNSRRVADAVQESMAETVAVGIMSMPSLVVNGKFLTSPDSAQGYSNTLAVLDYLLAGKGASVASPKALTDEGHQRTVPVNVGAACSTSETGSPGVTSASYPKISPSQLREMTGVFEFSYFYDPNCRSCLDFLGKTLPAVSQATSTLIRADKRSILDPAELTILDAELAKRGLSETALPVVVSGGVVLQGERDIQAHFEELVRSKRLPIRTLRKW